MSFSLTGFYVIFLIGGHAAPVPVLCGISAAFLQYFMLVYFGWTAAEAVYLYRKLVKVLGANISRYVLKAALIVWCKYTINNIQQHMFLPALLHNNYPVLFIFINS